MFIHPTVPVWTDERMCSRAPGYHHPKRGHRLQVPNGVRPSLRRHWGGPV